MRRGCRCRLQGQCRRIVDGRALAGQLQGGRKCAQARGRFWGSSACDGSPLLAGSGLLATGKAQQMGHSSARSLWVARTRWDATRGARHGLQGGALQQLDGGYGGGRSRSTFSAFEHWIESGGVRATHPAIPVLQHDEHLQLGEQPSVAAGRREAPGQDCRAC